jgi:hypothetical protein
MKAEHIEKQECLRCRHEWFPETPKRPSVCPACNSPKYDTLPRRPEHGWMVRCRWQDYPPANGTGYARLALRRYGRAGLECHITPCKPQHPGALKVPDAKECDAGVKRAWRRWIISYIAGRPWYLETGGLRGRRPTMAALHRLVVRRAERDGVVPKDLSKA